MESPKCWCIDGNNVAECGAGPFACGTASPGLFNNETGVQLCCAGNSVCGANSICGPAPGEEPAVGLSGYYLGGCTDKTFKDELCRTDCNGRVALGTQDIVYQQNLGVWSCCAKGVTGAVNCSDPLTEYSFETDWTPSDFPGPVDEPLTPAVTTTPGPTTASTSTTLISTRVTSSPSMTSQAASSSTTTTPPASGGFSVGAKAGIGVGVAVGALAILGLIIAVILLYRRISKDHSGSSNDQSAYEKAQRRSDRTSEHNRHQLDALEAYEMDSAKPSSVAVLHHNSRTHELEGTALRGWKTGRI